MLTEIVLFDLPPGMEYRQFLQRCQQVVPRWEEHPSLLRRNVLFDRDAGKGGGMFLWTSRQAAERAHDDAWRRRISALFGCAPEIRRFDTPIVYDHQAADPPT